MVLAVILSGLRQWRRSRGTAHVLAALTDQEPSDIGRTRGDTAQVGPRGK